MHEIRYYLSFEQVKPQAPAIMRVVPYDMANGCKQVGGLVFIHHNSLIVSALYSSVKEAIQSLHTYGKPVLLPNGETVIPRNANGYADSVFTLWHPGVRELWPGEPGYGRSRRQPYRLERA